MSDDRLRILEMIQSKTITAAEGAELLKDIKGICSLMNTK